MTVTMTTTRVDEDTYTLAWSSNLGGTPDYYVYLDGILNRVTKSEFDTIVVDAGDSVQVEVTDDVDQEPQAAFPRRARIHWNRVSGASRYHIYRKMSGTWTLQARQPEDGRAQYTWQTPVLADQTTHEFRVVAVGEDGNEGEPREFSIYMVRYPDVPAFTYSYNASTDALTIT